MWERQRKVENTLKDTKFEVSISNHYEDMKDDTKCRKWGGLG